MKTNNSILALTVGVAIVAFAGCSKSSTPTGEAPSTNAVSAATDAAKDMAGKAVDTAKDVAGKVVATATNLVSGATMQFTESLATAKNFMADKKYQAALGELSKLSSLQLTPDQAKVVDDLKTEATKLLSSTTTGAADAAKGLFGK